jgi:hypothetical protein
MFKAGTLIAGVALTLLVSTRTAGADDCQSVAQAAYDAALLQCTNDCHNRQGTSVCDAATITSQICRAVHGNECIAAGTPNVLIDVYTQNCRNYDGCGNVTASFTQAAGEQYNRCGC